MDKRSWLLSGQALAVGLLLGCGGNVQVSNGGSGGGGSGGSTTSSGGGTTTTTTTVTMGGTAGAGGTTGTTITTGSVCNGLYHVACLEAYPTCVPVYDDMCCPSCNPGPCADCINLDFDHCVPREEACDGQKPSCGLTPDWACQGGKADCPLSPDGSPEPCHTVAGCLAAYCNLEQPPCAGPECHPVTKGTCTTNCDSVPPPCGPNQIAESDGFCYTGMCIDLNICVPKLGGN